MKRQNVRSMLLVVVMMVYILVGAAIFEHLEATTEEARYQVLEDEKLEIQKRFNLSLSAWEEITRHIVNFMPHRAGFQWRYAGAVYFSTTVVTTIGYGHCTPKTNWGKIFCMLYALVGIPLNLVMFQSIGERLNTLNTYLICGIKRKVAKHRAWPFKRNKNAMAVEDKVEEKSNREKQRCWFKEQTEVEETETDVNKVDYYIQINQTTLQEELFEPPKRKIYINLNSDCKPIFKAENTFGADYFHNKMAEPPQICIDCEKSDSNEHLDLRDKSLKRQRDLGDLQRASINEILSSSFATNKFHLSDTHLICVTTAISSIFVAGGAYAYSRFEGWSYLDSLYYCIITLTTVGFGDLVALQNNKELTKKPEYVALNILFILTGLAVVSAAMNLLVLRFLTMNTLDEKRDMIKETILNSKEDNLEVDLLSNSQIGVCKESSSCEVSLAGRQSSPMRRAVERLCRIGRNYFSEGSSTLASSPPTLRYPPVHHPLGASHRHFLQIPRLDHHPYGERFPHQKEFHSMCNFYHSRSRLLTL